ncbi:50S ribosomal protein L14 [Candidatus Roizmanbacteria bacterium CG22_combo_CG10-13_8_21_14_all_38_20]|uniref:Large ribosomal subunit protein uL14 n=1 Tax=Candidatus Roizmanbacteria bacterium CG22_combo_CG10-13_8_21_14_all_38_20 TaxID=1974862 RepID=A0A2H0BWU3_9BACT|nr:50S ribosomal protein L14 [Candidatus Microgenomates bacterium]PIP62163.1 MAG: 50S ribosomal protein L14 [Candidatus Roizmanbacteria bacterium CG22_combo_CG10-13_8_21_14_all_38_20]PJC30899.1 MAG: 50S ribosomal protein L14 [Candidatus Roizmanbacteria bacterium CG_4_9_14_0_2_um_filter_38_17]
MVQLQTKLKVTDNSGAKGLMVVQVLGKRRKDGKIGDIVIASVTKADPLGAVKDHTIVKAVVVRTRKEQSRSDGSHIRFSDNAAVVLENVQNKTIIGTRVFGPVARELRELGFDRIISLAKEVY